MPLHESTSSDPILRLPQVAKFFDVHPNTITNQVKRGEFPAPLQLTRGARPRIGWLRSTCVKHRDALLRDAEARTRAAAGSAT